MRRAAAALRLDFSNALNECDESWWTSSMMNTF